MQPQVVSSVEQHRDDADSEATDVMARRIDRMAASLESEGVDAEVVQYAKMVEDQRRLVRATWKRTLDAGTHEMGLVPWLIMQVEDRAFLGAGLDSLAVKQARFQAMASLASLDHAFTADTLQFIAVLDAQGATAKGGSGKSSTLKGSSLADYPLLSLAPGARESSV